MTHDPFTPFRVLAFAVFLGLLAIAFLAAKNFRLWSGKDHDMPSENASQRTYMAVMIVLVWIHAVVITAVVALGLH
jgi:hypothetical protein